MNNKVVYAYSRKDGTFYYIGIGSPSRPYSSSRTIPRPSDNKRIHILHRDLHEETSKEYEKKLIAFYGRKDLGEGLLRNKTDGGEGTFGLIRSQEQKDYISKLRQGWKPSEYMKEQQLKAVKGVKKSELHKKRIGLANKGVPRDTPKKPCPHCGRVMRVNNLPIHIKHKHKQLAES